MKLKQLTGLAITILILALSASVAMGKPSTAIINAPGAQVFIACQWSPPGASGPSIKRAPRNTCVRSNTPDAVAVFRYAATKRVTMCVELANQQRYSRREQNQRSWCTTQVVVANHRTYFGLPTREGDYILSFYDRSAQVKFKPIVLRFHLRG